MGGSQGPSPWDIWYARNRHYSKLHLDSEEHASKKCGEGHGDKEAGSEECAGGRCDGEDIKGDTGAGEVPREAERDESDEACLLAGPVSIWV